MEKKRDREQGGILGGVAELFDLLMKLIDKKLFAPKKLAA